SGGARAPAPDAARDRSRKQAQARAVLRDASGRSRLLGRRRHEGSSRARSTQARARAVLRRSQSRRAVLDPRPMGEKTRGVERTYRGRDGAEESTRRSAAATARRGDAAEAERARDVAARLLAVARRTMDLARWP